MYQKYSRRFIVMEESYKKYIHLMHLQITTKPTITFP